MTTMNANAKFWNHAADKYAARPVANISAFERKKAITREHLTKDATILEIGCGTGSLALEMSPFAGHIHAMDISSEMIRIANGKKKAQGVTNVTFHQGTLDGSLPFEPGQLDGAWAYSILHLLENRRGTLERLFELLKPGGSFISSNVCLQGTWVPYGALIAVLRWFGKAPMVHLYDRDTILRELREVGFSDIVVHEVVTDTKVAFLTATKPREPNS
jgi:ubiquinone/menaquinone biosynthesis C-methylase UbiE